MDNIKPIIHDFNSSSEINSMKYSKFFLILFVVLLLGGLSGFLLSKTTSGSTTTTNKTTDSKVEKTAGIADKKTFDSKAEGILKEGGIDGEGSFHLVRPGGESQNAYLTSSAVDLSKYVGKKVRVWGETFKGEKAGWLMDVGLVELL